MIPFSKQPRHASRCAPRAILAGLLALSGACLTACESQHASRDQSVNPALRHIEPPPGGDSHDADRAALARFVGVWEVAGWSGTQADVKESLRGIAAATVENGHFVLLDMLITDGQLAGRVGKKTGSMLLAVEPDIGLTLTAWGDASPGIGRSVGRVEGAGSRFHLRETRTPPGRRAVSMDIEFQTDDRWTARIQDASDSSMPVIAYYTFSRAVR